MLPVPLPEPLPLPEPVFEDPLVDEATELPRASSKATSFRRAFALTYFWTILPFSLTVDPTTIRSISGWNSTRREVMVDAVQSSGSDTPMDEKPTLKMPMPARRIF